MNAEEYVSTFSRFGRRAEDLGRIASLLGAAGDPQDGMRFIHIAGTNGKGSMAQMFSEVYTRAGYVTGLFTSPYIIEYSDRIRVNGENIPPDELERTVEELRAAIDAHPLREDFSQFEITQAIAFRYFQKKRCDVVVLETGLGGLLDSTNVISSPLLSVIGSVDLDHTAILGNTIEEIAFQKAGIIKRGCPCVLSPCNREETVEIVRKKAAECGSRLVIPDMSQCSVICSDITGSRFRYKNAQYQTAMAGEHQIRNALTVIEGIKLAADSLKVSDEDIAKGIAAAKICGRTEVLCRSPLVILDGSHNPDGIRALGKVLSGLGGIRINAVIGMHRDKNIFGAVGELTAYVDNFTAVDGFSDMDVPAEELARTIRAAGGKASADVGDIISVIKRAVRENPNGATVICGSLYLAAYVKTHLNNSLFSTIVDKQGKN